MARPQLKISVPQPCSENWADMTPQAQGRFCASCVTTVVDFSQFTDKQLLEYFTKRSGKTCGRFSATQLDRAVYAEALAKQNFLPRALAAVALFLGISSQTQAQNVPDQPVPASYIETGKNAAAEKTVAKSPEKVSGNSLVISGRVTDRIINEPMAGVVININNSKIGTVTDLKGNYKLVVPDSFQIQVFSISARFIGYKTEEFEISRNQLLIEKDFALNFDERSVSTGIIVTEVRKTPGYYLRSFWWKTKSLFTDEY